MPSGLIRTIVAATLLVLGSANSAISAPATQNVVIDGPNEASQTCSEADFGAVQIRIGLHATLAACFRDVEMNGDLGTAFVTVPREFEGRTLTRKEFETFQTEIKETEEGFRIRAQEDEPKQSGKSSQTRKQTTKPVALGVFDIGADRVGYAYAYAINEVDKQGRYRVQPMMRTESFVLVNGRVILLMLIAPINDGVSATNAFDLSEQWARRIIASSADVKTGSLFSAK